MTTTTGWDYSARMQPVRGTFVSSEHLRTMPCHVSTLSTLQCIVWTFGEKGRRGSTVFTAEWDYSARMQSASV